MVIMFSASGDRSDQAARFLPYKDHQGRWKWPWHTQRRYCDGAWQYRERAETDDEMGRRVW
jgi:hypothetical protein